MSGICGWFGVGGAAPKPARALECMARQLSFGRVYPRHASWGPHAGLYADSGRPHVDDTLWASLDGTPNWSSPELAASAKTGSHSKALALAYRRFGSNLLKYLHGPFALAVIDLAADKALLAIDRMGVYRQQHAGVWQHCDECRGSSSSHLEHRSASSIRLHLLPHDPESRNDLQGAADFAARSCAGVLRGHG